MNIVINIPELSELAKAIHALAAATSAAPVAAAPVAAAPAPVSLTDLPAVIAPRMAALGITPGTPHPALNWVSLKVVALGGTNMASLTDDQRGAVIAAIDVEIAKPEGSRAWDGV